MAARILVVSQAWPYSQRTGVPLAAAMHVRMLVDSGCRVDIVGSNTAVLEEDLPVDHRFYVHCSGTGALYAPARVDRRGLAQVLKTSKPDLVVVEAWQTALTDAAVDVAYGLRIPVMMISHGVSVHPFTSAWVDRLRAWAWWPYRQFSLPARVRKLRLLAVLDLAARSQRFYDRDLAQLSEVPVCCVANAPANFLNVVKPRSVRLRKILCVGYFSRVKNQMAAIDLLEHLPSDVILHFIGSKSGSYYLACVDRVIQSGLQDRVIFSDDTECDVSKEMANSMLLLSTSITEALPLVLLEAMASGTPFAATPVGAVTSLNCGVVSQSSREMSAQIRKVLDDERYWSELSEAGVKSYKKKYTLQCVRQQLLAAVNTVLKDAIR